MANTTEDHGTAPQIHGLTELIKACEVGGTAPLEQWNPPYCGDIGLAIEGDGSWHYRGSPISRLALVKLFARVLTRDAEGGYYLVTPVEKIDVTVADAPFIAVEMEVRRHGEPEAQEIVLRTNLDDIVTAGPKHPLRFIEAPDGGTKPYVEIRRGLRALLSRALTHDLLASAVEDADGHAGIWSGGEFFRVPG